MKYLVLALLLTAFPAAAYPTSVFFAPTGEARELGSVNVFSYTPTNMRPFGSGASWFGTQVGVMPTFTLGDVELGGAEVGLDLLGLPTPTLVFNAKFQLIGPSVHD